MTEVSLRYFDKSVQSAFENTNRRTGLIRYSVIGCIQEKKKDQPCSILSALIVQKKLNGPKIDKQRIIMNGSFENMKNRRFGYISGGRFRYF